jgi:hypothetical protein
VDSVALLFGLALYAATVLAVHRWISAIPARVALLLRAEREVGQKEALDALQAAAGARVAQVVSALCQHEEQAAAVHRARETAADNRARVAEGRADAAARREGGAVTALEAASALVTQLRTILDAAPRSKPADEPADPQARRTVEMKRTALPQAAAGDDDEPEEEKTQVAKRPALEQPTSSGLRLAKPTGRGAAS